MSARAGEPSCPPKTAKALQPVSYKKPLDPGLNADACEKVGEWSPIINPPPTAEKKKGSRGCRRVRSEPATGEVGPGNVMCQTKNLNNPDLARPFAVVNLKSRSSPSPWPLITVCVQRSWSPNGPANSPQLTAVSVRVDVQQSNGLKPSNYYFFPCLSLPLGQPR